MTGPDGGNGDDSGRDAGPGAGAGQGSWLLIQIAELIAIVVLMKVFFLAAPHASRTVQWVVFGLVLVVVMVGAYVTRRYLRRRALPTTPHRPHGT